MKRHYDIWAVLFVTGYLIACYVFLISASTILPGILMILFSPVLVCLMVYVVLRLGSYTGPSLDKKEFGYQDKMTNNN